MFCLSSGIRKQPNKRAAQEIFLVMCGLNLMRALIKNRAKKPSGLMSVMAGLPFFLKKKMCEKIIKTYPYHDVYAQYF